MTIMGRLFYTIRDDVKDLATLMGSTDDCDHLDYDRLYVRLRRWIHYRHPQSRHRRVGMGHGSASLCHRGHVDAWPDRQCNYTNRQLLGRGYATIPDRWEWPNRSNWIVPDHWSLITLVTTTDNAYQHRSWGTIATHQSLPFRGCLGST